MPDRVSLRLARRPVSSSAHTRGHALCAAVAALAILGATLAEAQTPPHEMPGSPAAGEMVHDKPFYREGTFHALVGAIVIGGALILYRILRSRPRRRAGPAGFVSEAVLAVDLVDSTRLATHYGEAVALRARNSLGERIRRLTEEARSFLETTGDGCLATFPAVTPALEAAVALVRGLHERPDDLGPVTRLEVRVGVTYGEILLDARGVRHGAAINKAFRLLGVAPADVAELKGAAQPAAVPARTRILVDEDAAQELGGMGGLRFAGFAQLKGFTGLHRLYEVTWQTTTPPASAAQAADSLRRGSDHQGGTQ